MNVVIDGRFILDEADLHRRLAGALGYGPYYCHDLDDLGRRLASGDPRPLQLVWIYAASLRLALGLELYDRYVRTLEEIEATDVGRDWNERFIFRVFE
ncbi:barstar family protein [Couchioplanes caeruleus]|uniref:RNAse (Barnase) inhibitor barstar n=1 Tax=Couchioplanes caeruleus TaxID=56438 RepID=A0A3N1GGJ0_9ACTN|nr:barstar family protein [Couchioplanes caeruleus]ROP29393.1 RNAse (barnase) inhibitor barstar [Couchioplanes caeruleus]